MTWPPPPPGTSIWEREPVALLALIEALIALAASFGADLTAEQVGALVAVSSILLGLAARSRVTPVP